MMIKIFVGVVIFALAAALAFGAYVSFTKKNKFTGIVAVILALVMVVALAIVPGSIHQVNEGEAAVVRQFGKAVDIRKPGMHFDLNITKNYQIWDTKVQTIEIETPAYSSDAQLLTLAISFQYKIMSDKLLNIVAEYGSMEALDTRITSVVLDKTKSVFSSYTAMNIIAERSSMSDRVEEILLSTIGESYFVTVTEVAVKNIDFSDAFEKAVEDKMVAEQNKLKAQYDAEATIVEAQAQADANKLLEKSLTDNVLKEKYIEKWDGKLPEVVAGNDTGIMIDMTEE